MWQSAIIFVTSLNSWDVKLWNYRVRGWYLAWPVGLNCDTLVHTYIGICTFQYKKIAHMAAISIVTSGTKLIFLHFLLCHSVKCWFHSEEVLLLHTSTRWLMWKCPLLRGKKQIWGNIIQLQTLILSKQFQHSYNLLVLHVLLHELPVL